MSDDRTPSDDLRPATPEPSDSGEALIAAAERKRGRAKPVAADPALPPTRRRRKPAAPREATAGTEPGDAPPPASAPAVTASAPSQSPRAWATVAVCAALALLVLSAAAAVNLPKPLPVDRVEVRWLEGPQAPQREVDGWLATFPGREQLAETNGWVMGKLAEHLLAQPGVGEVRVVRLKHETSSTAGRTRLIRVLEVELGMRRPYMPGVLATGTRVWVDREGVVLPGSLQGPDRRRPLLRQLEHGGGNLRAAVEAWRLIEPMVEPNLVASIDCAAPIDERGARGIVLNASAGSRLVWGRPDETALGRDPESKARDLVHTIRCQGDLSRIASVNVRFSKPFYTLR
jgi:hypothetical protein